jgi:hypothetical protein
MALTSFLTRTFLKFVSKPIMFTLPVMKFLTEEDATPLAMTYLRVKGQCDGATQRVCD